MSLGEKVKDCGATIDRRQAVCEVVLRSTAEDAAVFVFECLDQTPRLKPKCPSHQ